MSKVTWKSGTFLYPLPAVMVSCGNMEKSNIITVAWTGILNTNPAMVYISVRPTRYSYNLIKESGEFVINLTTKDLAYATDWCGVKTGAKVDKFAEMHLTKEKAKFVKFGPFSSLEYLPIEGYEPNFKDVAYCKDVKARMEDRYKFVKDLDEYNALPKEALDALKKVGSEMKISEPKKAAPAKKPASKKSTKKPTK